MARVDVRRWEAVGLLLYSALLALALLWPTSGNQSRMAGWVTATGLSQAQAEFVCNVLIVAPVSALGSLRWPHSRWWAWLLGALAGASLVEIIQGALLPDRTPSLVDVIANALGGLLGALVVDTARRVRR